MYGALMDKFAVFILGIAIVLVGMVLMQVAMHLFKRFYQKGVPEPMYFEMVKYQPTQPSSLNDDS